MIVSSCLMIAAGALAACVLSSGITAPYGRQAFLLARAPVRLISCCRALATGLLQAQILSRGLGRFRKRATGMDGAPQPAMAANCILPTCSKSCIPHADANM